MRLPRTASVLPYLLLLAPILATAQIDAPAKEGTAAAPAEDDTAPKSTTFNGIEVPPLKDLSGDKFDEEIKDGYWYVR
jgi:protein disulfide-isomerase